MEQQESVYVLTNDCMPGIVKIGYTTQPVDRRVAEISRATGVPTPFKVAFRQKVKVGFARKVELATHKKLKSKRLNKSREFFSISVDEAEKTIVSVTNDLCALDKPRVKRDEVVRQSHKASSYTVSELSSGAKEATDHMWGPDRSYDKEAVLKRYWAVQGVSPPPASAGTTTNRKPELEEEDKDSADHKKMPSSQGGFSHFLLGVLLIGIAMGIARGVGQYLFH